MRMRYNSRNEPIGHIDNANVILRGGWKADIKQVTADEQNGRRYVLHAN